MKLCIVIVNYRAAGLVVDCLHSLASEREFRCDWEVTVVDNASGDDSVSRLEREIEEEGWSDWVRMAPQERNGGFSFGNNVGIRLALDSKYPPAYFLLLNPDTVVCPGAIHSLIEFMEAHESAGIAGSLLENLDGQVDCSAHRMHSPFGELESSARLGVLSRLLKSYMVSSPPEKDAHQCDWVSGAAMILRRQVVEHIGLMDEGFFLYFEEVDYCSRAKKAGWECWYVPESRVVHLEGATTGIRAPAKRRPAYWYDSRRRFFVKHHGILGLLTADLLWALGRLSFLLRAAFRLTRQDCNDPKYFMRDLLWGDLLALLHGQLITIQADMRR